MILSYIKGVMDKFKRNDEKKFLMEILSDSRAVYSGYGQNIFMSDFVNNCIDRIASEIGKIEVVSVLADENNVKRLHDDISRLFKFKPNEFQTTKDFLSSCEWLRRKFMNCFVYPKYDIVKTAQGKEFRRYTAFYPLNPVSAELGYFDDGRRAIKFFWRDGSTDTLPYDSIVHLRWRRGTSLLMGGGDDYGNIDDDGVKNSLKLFGELVNGLPKMIQASLGLNGILTAKTMLESKALESKRDEFEDHIYKSKSGIVAIDLASDFTPIQRQFPEIPESTLKFIKDIIRERYGISQAILSGDYDGKTHAAFYQSCIESFLVEFEQAFTSILFTPREIDVGHKIKCYYSRVAYMDTAEKRQLASLAKDTGLMTLNEIRELYGLSPIEEGNRRLQSLNYVNTELVDAYQAESKQNSDSSTGAGKKKRGRPEDVGSDNFGKGVENDE